MIGGAALHLVFPERFSMAGSASLSVLAIAGLLVGFGTRLGSGCTSGHGVCGIARGSKRSIVATLTFMVTARDHRVLREARVMSRLYAFAAGLIFALGLTLSGMTEPARVLAFLDVAGAWDPALAFVMGAALAVYGVLWRVIARRPRPLAADAFDAPSATRIDARLLGGAAIFGVGWGLSGLCPAPALSATGAGAREALVFSLAMVAGMLAFRALVSRLRRERRHNRSRSYRRRIRRVNAARPAPGLAAALPR